YANLIRLLDSSPTTALRTRREIEILAKSSATLADTATRLLKFQIYSNTESEPAHDHPTEELNYGDCSNERNPSGQDRRDSDRYRLLVAGRVRARPVEPRCGLLPRRISWARGIAILDRRGGRDAAVFLVGPVPRTLPCDHGEPARRKNRSHHPLHLRRYGASYR